MLEEQAIIRLSNSIGTTPSLTGWWWGGHGGSEGTTATSQQVQLHKALSHRRFRSKLGATFPRAVRSSVGAFTPHFFERL